MEPVILVINPNTSRAMTQSIRESAEKAGKGCRIITRCAAKGPETIETPLDEALSIPGMVEAVLGEDRTYDAIVSACFDDPGLELLRRVFHRPVVGIGQSAFTLAATMPGGFSVLITQKESIEPTRDRINRNRYGQSLHTVHALGIPVEMAETDPETVMEKMMAASKKLITPESPTLILGCAGLGKFAEALAQATNGYIIDPVRAGVRMAATVAALCPRPRLPKSVPAPKTLKGYSGLQSLYTQPEHSPTMEA